MSVTAFSFPTNIQFGAGARRLVAAHLREAGYQRPLLVTDKALATLPVLDEFKTHLEGLDVAVFSGVFGNPTTSQVMAGAVAFIAPTALSDLAAAQHLMSPNLSALQRPILAIL